MTLAVSQGGQIVWKRNKPKQVITSIHSWTTAFLIFSSIFVEAHPTRAQELLRYAHLIRTIHARFGGWGWRSYDQQFRMRQESHPQNSWSIIDGELWSVYVTSSSVSSSNRFQQQNKGYRSGFRQQFKSRSITSTQFGFMATGSSDRICFDFNKQASCSRKNCLYSHKCSKCKEVGHGAINCKK